MSYNLAFRCTRCSKVEMCWWRPKLPRQWNLKLDFVRRRWNGKQTQLTELWCRKGQCLPEHHCPQANNAVKESARLGRTFNLVQRNQSLRQILQMHQDQIGKEWKSSKHTHLGAQVHSFKCFLGKKNRDGDSNVLWQPTEMCHKTYSDHTYLINFTHSYVARQVLSRIHAHYSEKFLGLKLWLCKNDKYQVWPQLLWSPYP